MNNNYLIKLPKYFLFSIIFSVVFYILQTPKVSANFGNAIFFNGTGNNQLDRIIIPINGQNGASKNADIGNTNFTIEWWMKAKLSDNSSGVCRTGNDNWITGNIIVDRDIYGNGDYGDYGISLHGGKIAFGVNNGTNGTGICSTKNVADDNWHHIAVTRNFSNGQLKIFIDGVLDTTANGVTGDISYRDGRNSNYVNDPNLVLGAEKHDEGINYPSYKGWFDEFRISNNIRYTNNFNLRNTEFVSDNNTVLLYHLNEGRGNVINDSSSSLITGVLKQGSTWGVSTINTQDPTPNVTPSSNSNDLNNDAKVDILDILDLIKKIFNSSFLFVNPNANPDINNDNIVNLLDAIALIQLVFGANPTPSPSPTPIPTATIIPTPTPTQILPTPTPTPVVSPTPVPTPTGSSTGWTQHGANAQRTSYTDEEVSLPWKWKWSFNGSDASGRVISGKFKMPRNSQPIIAAGRVFLSVGSGGVYAFNSSNGTVIWSKNPGGTINSTPAYDSITNALFVVSTNGYVYKLDIQNGNTLASFNMGATSTLPLPPAIQGDNLYVAMGPNVYNLKTTNLSQVWKYTTTNNSLVATPVSYSQSRNRVIVVTQDLYVHAINASNGTQAFRVKPTPRNGGNPGENNKNLAEATYGWPVIAENSGLVLIKYRLDWQTLWATYQPNNNSIRSFLQSNPEEQALYAVSLDNGSVPFISNIGHGGYGNGGYMPMGFQPAVKKLPNGKEVAYVMARGDTKYDPRWDTHVAEMVLDNSTIAGYPAGYFRYIDYAGTSIDGRLFLTDEQPFISAAGNFVFMNHWEASMYSLKITDRSDSRGSYANPITSQTTPTLIESLDTGACNSTTHFTQTNLTNTRYYPSPSGGFYIYCNEGYVYDRYWSNYAQTVVGDGLIITISNSGALFVLGK